MALPGRFEHFLSKTSDKCLIMKVLCSFRKSVFQQIVNENREVVKPTGDVVNGFQRFTLIGKSTKAVMCSKCEQVDANFGKSATLDLNTYNSSWHQCVSASRKRHMAESILCESASFYSAQQEPQSGVIIEEIHVCDHEIKFTGPSKNFSFTISCLEEFSSHRDLQSHKQICPMRCQKDAFEEHNKFSTGKLVWNCLKKMKLGPALIKAMNDDLSSESNVDNGITKLRSSVTIHNCDVYGLSNTSNVHVVPKKEKNANRRDHYQIALNADDIR